MPFEFNNGYVKVLFIVSIILASNCLFGSVNLATPKWTTLFSSGFEEPNLITPKWAILGLEKLFLKGNRWSRIREQDPCYFEDCLPNKLPSQVQTVFGVAHSGSKSLSCFADGGDSHYVSKADIYKTNLLLKIGETYRVSAWYRLPSQTFVKTVTIMDLECHDCGVKSAGPRMWVGHRRDSDPPRIFFGRGKLNLKSYEGSLPLPMGEWFKVTVEITLGVKEAGRSRVWINDQLDIDEIGTNIKPEGYQGLDHYNFLQFGITANATGTAPNGQYSGFTLYVDDVLIEQKVNGLNTEDQVVQ